VRRLAAHTLALALAALAGAWMGNRLRAAPRPDALAVLERVREIARFETLELNLYKKVDFRPDPPPADTFWQEVFGWIRHTVRPPRGKAIVFARATVGFDLGALAPEHLRSVGRELHLVWPPLAVNVALLPGETEIIASNLDSAETAQLLELARAAFARELEADPRIRERARASFRRALEGLAPTLGYRNVHLSDSLSTINSQ
jgi:hypothetical protein